MALNRSSRNFWSVPCRTRTQWALGRAAAPKPRSHSRGAVSAAHRGKPFAGRWVSQKREGMLKEGGNSLWIAI